MSDDPTASVTPDILRALKRIATGWRITYLGGTAPWLVYWRVPYTASAFRFSSPAEALDFYKFQCAKAGA